MRSTRQVICVTAFALTVFTQLLISQTPSPSHQSSNSAATAKASNGKVTCADNGTYQNSRGETVRRPENCSGSPEGASAQCRDGSYSFSRSRRGTCSHHGGVAKWL
jgi:hypothetical protein